MTIRHRAPTGDRHQRLVQLLIGTSLLAASATPAFAQDTVPAEDTASEARDENEIVVTARRREESLQDVPVAVTAIGGATLEKYAVADIQQISQLVPSMVVGRQASGSSASIFLRGVGSTSLSSGFDQSVSLNMDGLPMSRGKELLTGQYDLQRVEVLKGPQALFFGKNSTGGVVILTSNDPTPDWEGSVRLGYETEAREMYGEGYISGPIAPYLGVRLAVRGSTAEGSYINSAQTNNLGSPGLRRVVYSDRRGAMDTMAGRLTLMYDNPDVVKITLKGSVSMVDDDSASALYERICAAGRTTPRATGGIPESFTNCAVDGVSGFASMPEQIARVFPYARDGKPYTDYDAYSLVGTIEKSFGDITVTSVTGQYGFRQEDLQTAAGSTAGVYFTQRNKFRQFSQELRIASDFDGAFNFTAGGLYAKTHYFFDTAAMASAVVTPSPTSGRYDTFQRVNGIDGDTLSAFAELNVTLMDSLELAGGARWSRERKTSYANQIYSGSAAFPINRFDDEFEDYNVSPQATLTWKATDDITLYGAYKQGFKAGGYNTSISILASSRRGDGEFGSEYAEGGEIGLRTQMWDRQIRFNVTGYHYRFKDLQVQVFDAATTASRVSNAGALTTNGVEVELNVMPRGSGFEAHASLAYNEAKFSNFANASCYTGQTFAEGCNQSVINGVGNAQSFNGRIAPKAPKFAGRVGASYETAVSGGVSFGLSGDVSFSSSYNYTDTLRPDGVQPAFAKFDAGMRVFDEDDGWELALIGRNLTNEKVITTANDMPGQGAMGTGTNNPNALRSDMNGIVDRLRSVYLQFTKTF